MSGLDINTKKSEMTPDEARRKIIWCWIVTGILGFIITILVISSSKRELTQGFATNFSTTLGILFFEILLFFGIAWSLYWGIPKVWEVLVVGVIVWIAGGTKILDSTPKHYVVTSNSVGGYSVGNDYEENAKEKFPFALILLVILAVLIIIPLSIAILYGATVGTYRYYKLQKIASHWNRLYIGFTLIPILYLIINGAVTLGSPETISDLNLQNKLQHPEQILKLSDLPVGFKSTSGDLRNVYVVRDDCTVFKLNSCTASVRQLYGNSQVTGDVRTVSSSIKYADDGYSFIYIDYIKYDSSDGIQEAMDSSIDSDIREHSGIKTGNLNIGEFSGGITSTDGFGSGLMYTHLYFLSKNFYVQVEIIYDQNKSLNEAMNIAKIVEKRLVED